MNRAVKKVYRLRYQVTYRNYTDPSSDPTIPLDIFVLDASEGGNPTSPSSGSAYSCEIEYNIPNENHPMTLPDYLVKTEHHWTMSDSYPGG